MRTSRRVSGLPAAGALALLVLASATARAEEARIDGHELRARCAGEVRRGACLNELIIVADMHEVVAAWGLADSQWCMPAEVPPERLREIVLGYLDDAAGELREPSTRLIAAAYARAFPCP